MDTIKNIDKFEKGQLPLLITGYSGSGKSTLAKEYAASHKCDYIELDALQRSIKGSIPNWEQLSWPDKCKLCVDTAIKSVGNKKAVIEGVHVSYADKEILDKYPLVVLGTPLLKYVARATTRGFGNWDEDKIPKTIGGKIQVYTKIPIQAYNINNNMSPYLEMLKSAALKGKKEETEDEDLRLYRLYKAGNQQALWDLLKRMKGPISKVALQHSNVHSRPVVEAKLKKWTIDAINTYDPSKGTKLLTHIMNYYKQIHRFNTTHQQAVRLPENIAAEYGRFQEAKEYLTDLYKREPTSFEMSEHLGWGLDFTQRVQKRFHKELVESRLTFEPATLESDITGSAIRYAYHSMNDEERYIFEHKTGYLGKPIAKSVDTIRKNLNMTPHRFHMTQKSIEDKIKEALDVREREG